jgi:hypothetical protein
MRGFTGEVLPKDHPDDMLDVLRYAIRHILEK